MQDGVNAITRTSKGLTTQDTAARADKSTLNGESTHHFEEECPMLQKEISEKNCLVVKQIDNEQDKPTNKKKDKHSDREKQRDKQREQDEARLTRTLIVLVCVFILGETPSAFTSRSMVVALLGGDQSILQSGGYRVAVLVSTLLVVAQHSINFVVYCVFNRRFCDALRARLPVWCGGVGRGGPRGDGGVSVGGRTRRSSATLSRV